MVRSIAALLILFFASAAQAAPMTTADLVNLSGRQRMLSQRIVKAYVQVGMKVATDQSRQILADSLDQFAGQLEQLRAAASSPEQKALVAQVGRLWPQVRKLASKPVDRRHVAALDLQANELLMLSDRLAGLIAADGNLAIGRLVNVAGRQRMLSQRLAKAYMLRAWGIDAPSVKAELEASQQEFAAALQLLAQAPENTPEIRRELEAVALQWNWFQTALELEGAFSYRLLVADSSESLLAGLEKLVALYTLLGR